MDKILKPKHCNDLRMRGGCDWNAKIKGVAECVAAGKTKYNVLNKIHL